MVLLEIKISGVYYQNMVKGSGAVNTSPYIGINFVETGKCVSESISADYTENMENFFYNLALSKP